MRMLGITNKAGGAHESSRLMKSDEPLDDGEAEGLLLPGEAGRRTAQEHCATNYAEEHGYLIVIGTRGPQIVFELSFCRPE